MEMHAMEDGEIWIWRFKMLSMCKAIVAKLANKFSAGNGKLGRGNQNGRGCKNLQEYRFSVSR